MAKFIKIVLGAAAFAQSAVNAFTAENDVTIEFIEVRPCGETHDKVCAVVQYEADAEIIDAEEETTE